MSFDRSFRLKRGSESRQQLQIRLCSPNSPELHIRCQNWQKYDWPPLESSLQSLSISTIVTIIINKRESQLRSPYRSNSQKRHFTTSSKIQQYTSRHDVRSRDYKRCFARGARSKTKTKNASLKTLPLNAASSMIVVTAEVQSHSTTTAIIGIVTNNKHHHIRRWWVRIAIAIIFIIHSSSSPTAAAVINNTPILIHHRNWQYSSSTTAITTRASRKAKLFLMGW